MNENDALLSESSSRRVPWNKGKLPGAKPPLRPSHVWSIRTKLQLDQRMRDLALFNLAIDSKLRGCDVVAIRVDDVAPNGYTLDRATIRQKKTGRPVRFEITEQTRHAIDDYLKVTGRQSGQFLFAGRGGGEARGLTTRQYARLVSGRPSHDPGKLSTRAVMSCQQSLALFIDGRPRRLVQSGRKGLDRPRCLLAAMPDRVNFPRIGDIRSWVAIEDQ